MKKINNEYVLRKNILKTFPFHSSVFLCLFNGLRIPTIRRLSRHPGTICFDQLNNFDPNLYCPKTTNIISKRYQKQIHCPVTYISIDPLSSNVMNIIRGNVDRAKMRTMSDRTIIHYYGIGVHPPTQDGNIFFFDDNWSKYKFIRLQTLLGYQNYPLTMIIDSNNAAVLATPLQSLIGNRDIVAFFSCKEDETLPSAPNMPLDILSSSILKRLRSAIWFHDLNSICSIGNNIKRLKKEMGDFLAAIIDSIALYNLEPEVYMRMFFCDPSLKEIARGFILATRILAYSNVHTLSIPYMPPTENSPQWGTWDTYLDAIASGAKDPLKKIFEEIKISFYNFKAHSLIPILLFFMTKPDYQEDVLNIIIDYIENQNEIPLSLLSLIASEIMKFTKLTAKHYCMMAKLFALGLEMPTEIDMLLPISTLFSNKDISKQEIEPEIIMAGMLSACCGIKNLQLQNDRQLLALCAQYSITCAPFSALLFGHIVSHMNFFTPNPQYLDCFIPLLENDRDDIRASACFAISFTRETRAIVPICKRITDPSEFVATEALITLSILLRFDQKSNPLSDEMKTAIIDSLTLVSQTTNDKIKDMFDKIRPSIDNTIRLIGLELPPQGQVSAFKMNPSSQIPDLLLKKVSDKGFFERVYNNIFS